MKCHVHYESDAVAQCSDCGKGLCPSCSDKYHIPLCNNCALSRVSANKQLLFRNTALMVILFSIGVAIAMDSNSDFVDTLLMGYMFAGIPWGWSVLNMITPNIFLIMPIVGWLIYFGVKFSLAMVIGMFVTPFKLFQIVKGMVDAKNMSNYAKSS